MRTAVSHLRRSLLWSLFSLTASATLSGAARADALAAVQTLRAGGCGGIVPLAPPLRRSAALERTAAEWAHGTTLATAAAHNGYGEAPEGVHVIGPGASLLEVLRRSECRVLSTPSLREIGVYQRGEDYWLVLVGVAAPPPAPALLPRPAPVPGAALRPAATTQPTPLLAARALELINEARARGARCGRREFGPAPPVTLSRTLDGVALGHAADMAEHNYFEHRDLTGQSPADRVRASGYRESLVGENIAYGPNSVDEAVQGWLDSPDHCENIMDPRFAQMGIASASARSVRRGLYWVQLLAEPRA
ncbi:MAG TPA: CAP domain-containing protein [Steroidobacteraceae bacterium]|nr:CAP domain-containing protein [Steroidobacteraceae bacterium]